MENIDFVIPLKQNNVIIRTVIEGIVLFYSPRNIFIITDPSSNLEINIHSSFWKINNTIIKCIDENIFYKIELERKFSFKDEKSREYGWWFQQIIKLDAVNKIKNISDPFVVWDADLIPLKKWELYNNNSKEFYSFAVLQECSKNEFNTFEYSSSIMELIKLEIKEPTIGTFVPHHFVFYHKVIKSLHDKIGKDKWQEKIMELSSNFYRFSEYKCVATFMQQFYPELLMYHEYEKYGKNGIRFRESLEIQEKIKKECNIEYYGLSYSEFKDFVKNEFGIIKELSYLQIEHIV
jgi:hypothetical protein